MLEKVLGKQLNRFYPQYYVKSVYDIDYKDLKRKGKIGLVFDLDNTLAPFDIEEPTEEIINFITNLTKDGFKVCLVSNNKGNRVQIFNKKLGLVAVPKAGKPKTKGIKIGLQKLGVSKSEAVMIGDQMFTDVWVGNRMGMTTVLVKPIANRDEFTVKLKRGIERKVFEAYKRSLK